MTPWKLLNLLWSTSISTFGSPTAKGNKQDQCLKKAQYSFQHSLWYQFCHKREWHHPWVRSLVLVPGWEQYCGVLSPSSSPPEPLHHTIQPCQTLMVSPYPVRARQMHFCNSQETSVATLTDQYYTTSKKTSHYSKQGLNHMEIYFNS